MDRCETSQLALEKLTLVGQFAAMPTCEFGEQAGMKALRTFAQNSQETLGNPWAAKRPAFAMRRRVFESRGGTIQESLRTAILQAPGPAAK